MDTYPRRASTAIPPPPPLPPARQHQGQPRSSYFSRFVSQPFTAYGSRPQSASKPAGRPNPLVPRLPGISSGVSQDASHRTGLDISALDMNRERTHAIIAGKDILKTIRVKDAKCAEDTNLRTAIINYAVHNTRHRETMEIHDVKWSHGQFSTHIATAATNGKVILYDLNRAGMELARLHEHHRQVHKVAFNPHQGYLLLSGSQDATVRLWDLRDMRKDVMTCPSREKFPGLSEGIRDLQWSPTDGVEFAFGTDNGVIQRWDFRHAKGPKLKINAHEQKMCTSIDWHPDGKHLLSASTDRTVKIWDFSSDARRQKPAFVLRTPYPVHKARWRPPYWSDEFQDQGAYQCTQIATSYDRDHPVVHLWDFRRSFLPFREITRFNTAPSDMLWHSRDLLWTVGREGVFTQTDVHFSPKVVDRRNLQAIAVSPTGEVAGFVQKRHRQRRSGLEYSSVEDGYITDRDKRGSPEKSLRSSADDSVDESFLSSSYMRHHGRTSSNRSTRSFGSTPPSTDVAPKVMFLTDSMELLRDAMTPNQVGFRGALPGAMSIQVFTYLAQKYKSIPLPDPPTLESYLDLYQVFEQNAEYAERAAFYRLAQSWRIIGGSVAVAALRRAETHRKRRMDEKRILPTDTQPPIVKNATTAHGRSGGLLNPAVRAIHGPDKDHHHAAPAPESLSNLATPLARPYSDPKTSGNSAYPSLPDPDHGDDLTLPPAAIGPHSKEGKYLSPETANKPSGARRPSFNAPLWFANASNDLDERRAQIGSYRAPPRAPLNLDPPNSQGISIAIPPRLDRHDSDDSLALFSASTDSQRGLSMPSSFASSKSFPRNMDSIPEWNQQPEDSSFGSKQPTQPIQTGLDQGDNEYIRSFGQSVQYSPTSKPVGGANPGSRPIEQPGTDRSDTDQHLEHASRDRAIQDIETLRRNNQLLRHDSSESEAYSRDGQSEVSADRFHENMEASGTIIPDGPLDELLSPQGFQPVVGLAPEDGAPPEPEPPADEPLLLSDFQATDVDEIPHGLTVLSILRQALQFHTDILADAQTSSLIILLLSPLLPRSHPADLPTLVSYADHLSTLGLSPTQIDTILGTRLNPLLETGLNPYQAEAVLSTYHTQLHTQSLFNSAASLRRLAYPLYPAVYEQALKETQLGLLCLSCKSPINNPRDKMRCETCRRAQAPCPVCWGTYPAFEGAVKAKKAKLRSSASDIPRHARKRSSVVVEPLSIEEAADKGEDAAPTEPSAKTSEPRPVLWTWCPLCGHGGHTACLSAWFTDPMADGACATEGCLCDCVSGRRREERVRVIQGRKVARERGKVVRGDEWRVGESKAAGAAARVLAPQGDGIIRYEARRVRVMVPAEEGRYGVGAVGVGEKS